MARRAAESLCPGGVILERDRADEARRFEGVVELIEEFVPRVEIVEPGLVFVAIEGAVRFHGGEAHLVELLAKELDRRFEADARIGVAATPFAARVAAAHAPGIDPVVVRDDRMFLAAQDLAVLPNRDLVDTFRWLGLGTLGDLAALPREAIASRFGSVGLEAHRLASAESPPPMPRTIPVELAVEEVFEDPLEVLEQVAFAARSLGIRLMGGLRSAGVAPHVLDIEVEAVDGTSRTRTWRSADPFTEQAVIDRVFWQARGWVESRRGPTGGVVRLRIAPVEISGEGRQLGFLDDTSAVLEAERALMRIQAIVGPDRVLGSQPRGGRDPAERVAWHPWGEVPDEVDHAVGAPWPGSTPGPVPALVPPEPVPFTIDWDDGAPVRVRLRSRWVEVTGWAGPWRMTGRWWSGETDRDRYQVVTPVGAFLCDVTPDGTVLVGVYD